MVADAESEVRAQRYAQRGATFGADAERLESRSAVVSNLRGLSFTAFAVSSGVGLFGGGGVLAGALALICLTSFVVLVILHSKVIEARDTALRWQLVNQRGAARCRGEWRAFVEDGSELRDPNGAHPYADDLDLFGPGSLFQRVNVAHTRFGHLALYRFLAEPDELEAARERQAAVRQLAEQLETRQRLEALSLGLVPERTLGGSVAKAAKTKTSAEPPDPEALLRWAEETPTLSKQPLLGILTWVLPISNLAAVVLVWLELAPAAVLLAPLLASMAVIYRTGAEAGRVFAAVSATEGAFLRYAPMLELMEGLDLDASLVRRLREGLLSGPRRPSVAMEEFRRAVGWFDLRYNGLVHPVLNTLLLWDLRCVLRLERWQSNTGSSVRAWFRALGELEALSALAGYAHDEVHVCWPVLSSEQGAPMFAAQQLGHPLLEAGGRVNNDVALERPGTALLITGSNMSGKSTLMRAMGLGVVMARAGGPVCATSFALGDVVLRTSIRISDSLGGGVSHFYAEVRKLKAVLDATAVSEDRPDRPASGAGSHVFFLLDEILHGTNSRERQVGARWVLAELLRRGALGAVSTHDMGLCELPPDLMQRVEQAHLREDVINDRMTFDYRLRSGPVRSGNALRLMQLVGIPVPLESSDVP